MSDAPLENLTALQRIAAAQTAPALVYNTELVRSAWSAIQRRSREARRAAMRSAADFGSDLVAVAEDPLDCAWIEQLWTDHVLIKTGDGEGDLLRIPYTVAAPGTSPEDVRFGSPERVRVAYVAASAAERASALEALTAASDAVELSKRVRTMAGSRRYRKPIGSQLGTGAPGGEALATVARTGSRQGSGATPDKLRSSIRSLSKEKTYRGGKVLGDIGDEGKLKSALSQIVNLPDGRRGEAAAEVVKAAQALGLTSLVPVSVKRLYRQYIAQGRIENPASASTSKEQ